MIKRRLSSNRWVVSIDDPALSVVDDETMRQYALSRNIDLLADDVDLDKGIVKTTGERVTMVQVKPLIKKYEYLINTRLAEDSGARWEVFRNHVADWRNDEDEGGEPMLEWNKDHRAISEKCRERVDLAFVAEIATVVIEMASGKDGDSRPFTLPLTWSAERMRVRALPSHAVRVARIESASETPSPPETTPDPAA